MNTKLLPVNEASAALFLTQCIGTYSGHMSDIAFSPTIRAIAEAHGLNTSGWCGPNTKRDFAQMLRMVADQLSSEETPKPPAVTDEMVSRFLCWRLPATFNPDGGVSFIRSTMDDFWPVGTNILNAEEARQMLNHVLGKST